MKINCSIPKWKNVKEKINIVKEKIKKQRESKEKIQLRYYGLLFLMILLGTVTVATNIKTYNDITRENYIEYKFPADVEVGNNDVDISVFETAISSISTNVSNVTEEIEKPGNKENKTIEYIWPVEGEIIRDYAKDNLIFSKTMGMWMIHTGIDIKAKLDTEVKCIADGKVIAVENNSFYGNVVKIQHDEKYVSVYANLGDEKLPKLNQKVSQGEIIGLVGDTAYGESYEENHLHLEIKLNETNIDPKELLKY